MFSERVLVIGEESAQRHLHTFGLRCAGLHAEEINAAPTSIEQIEAASAGLILILAATLDAATRELVSRLRCLLVDRQPAMLMLVERGQPYDADQAYRWGIDDYLCAPIDPEVLMERVRVGLQCRADDGDAGDSLADLTLDDYGVARRGERCVRLRPMERRLLQFFIAHSEQVIPRDMLLFRVWGGGCDRQSRVVDVNVCRLRRALDTLGYDDMLQTVGRSGYRLSAQTRTTGVREYRHSAHAMTPR